MSSASDFLRLIWQPGEVRELRAPKTVKGTISGRYDCPEKMATDAIKLTMAHVPAVYFTLNPVTGPADNECNPAAATTGDGQIARRTLLLIDCDAAKPARIGDESSAAYGSTDAEHSAAIGHAEQIMYYLKDCAFPLPILGDSGNGAHLLYRLDLPSDDASTALLRDFLQALRRRFPAANIDEKVFNASRISKIYGTWVRKKHTAERPNRLSKLITEPLKELFTAVPADLLRRVIADNPSPATAPAHQPRPAATGADIEDSIEWVSNFILTHGIEVSEMRQNESGTWRCRWKLVTCPFCGLSDQSAVVTVSSSGAKGFACQHNRCKGNDWHKFRKLYEPASAESRHERLAREYVEHCRDDGHPIVCNKGVHLQYTGTHYSRVDDLDIAVRQWMLATGESQNNNIVSNVVPIVTASTYTRNDVPGWIGRTPPPFSDANDVVAFNNGLFELSTSVLHPHSTDWLSTYCLPFDFDPAASCPTWLRFLSSSLEDNQESIGLLQEWFGYCLTGDTGLHKALLLVGKPRGGKSTILKIQQKIVGRRNAIGYSLDSLAAAFGLQSLIDKAVAVVGEAELEGNQQRKKIVEMLKCIIGEDDVKIDIKYSEPIHTKLPTRFTIASNRVPRLHDSSGGLASRLLWIPFFASFVGKEDFDLQGKLDRELAGIVNWSLAGLRRLRANGGRFTVGAESKRMADQFGRETTPVKSWLGECLRVAPGLHVADLPAGCISPEAAPHSVPKAAVYRSYLDWCANNDEQHEPENWFHKSFRSALPKVQEGRELIDGKKVRVYRGVQIVWDSEDV